MATQTENYGLMKPTANEYYDVDVTNGNMDIIDAELKKRENEATEIVTTLSQHKSIFSAGTGKDSGNTEQDFHSIVEGQSNVKIEGSTAVNSIKNGDFNNGTTYWGTISATLSVTNNVLSIIGNGTGALVAVTYDARTLANGYKEYHRAEARVTNAVSSRLRMRLYSGTLDADVLNPIQNQWYDLSTIVTGTAGTAAGAYYKTEFNSNYADAAAANGKGMEVKDVIAINLTALFGAGNEPTKEQCDFMYDHYINGLQGVGSGRVNCLGKNIFGSRWMAERVVYLANQPNYCAILKKDGREVLAMTSTMAFSGLVVFNKFRPNTRYTVQYQAKMLSEVSAAYLSFYYTDGSWSHFTAEMDTSWVNYAITSAIGKTVESIKIAVGSSGTIYYDFNTFQIEEGEVATAYEPYHSSELTTTLPTGMQLHRLPNGVYDTIEEVNGARTLFKNTKEYTLQASDITDYGTGLTNCDIISIRVKADDAKYGSTTSYAIDNNWMIVHGFIGGNSNLVNSEGYTYRVYMTASGLYYGLIVPKGTYSSLAQAQTALVGTKIVYELAKPLIYTNGINGFFQEGNLEVYEDGVIYQESSVNSKEYNNAKLHITYNLSDKAIEMSNNDEITTIHKIIKGRLKNVYSNIESGNFSNSEGTYTKAFGQSAHAEGDGSKAYALYSHAEGQNTQAGGSSTNPSIGVTAHAEGNFTLASGEASHSEGVNTQATGAYAHAQNESNLAAGQGSTAMGGGTQANGIFSVSMGEGTRANGQSQAATGRFNVPNTTDLLQIGNGTSDANRSNALTLDAYGNLRTSGSIIPKITTDNTMLTSESGISVTDKSLKRDGKDVDLFFVVYNTNGTPFASNVNISIGYIIHSAYMPKRTIYRTIVAQATVNGPINRVANLMISPSGQIWIYIPNEINDIHQVIVDLSFPNND
ncbi:MAG: hypothetical protein K0R69_2803 [Clostridia bacterium]|jgi:hypothetical protein|nr:hypothetical protein [Clostridia bacterium]